MKCKLEAKSVVSTTFFSRVKMDFGRFLHGNTVSRSTLDTRSSEYYTYFETRWAPSLHDFVIILIIFYNSQRYLCFVFHHHQRHRDLWQYMYKSLDFLIHLMEPETTDELLETSSPVWPIVSGCLLTGDKYEQNICVSLRAVRFTFLKVQFHDAVSR